MKNITELLNLIQLEQIEDDKFRAESLAIAGDRVYGGQLLAQALRAAIETVPDSRFVHSFHSYFMLGGDVSQPIVYEINRLRDGGSFTMRHVTAIQYERPIFTMLVSFQVQQRGLEHQIEMPDVPPPEELVTTLDYAIQHQAEQPEDLTRERLRYPVEMKPIDLETYVNSTKRQPEQQTWVRIAGELPDAIGVHQAMLAFASDFNLLGTAMLPHFDRVGWDDVQPATLDHSMWFHHDFRMDDWLLFTMDSPVSSNTRGFTRGNFFTRDGLLVASVSQEGLIRLRRK